MDGRGGCCIARYATAGGHPAAYDMSQMDRIMLKYRPIAPKPVLSGAVPALSDGSTEGHGKAPSGRGRRKCSKDSSNNNSNSNTRRCTNGRKRKSSSPEQTTDKKYTESIPTYCPGAPVAVTLPLLPEAPDLSPTKQGPHKTPFWLSFNNTTTTPGVPDNYNQSHSNNPTVVIAPPQQPTVVGSYVIVEAVTDTCPPLGVRVADVRALEKDTCPVIVSDVWNRVLWANEAYRRMVVGDTWQDRRVGVGLVMREKVPDRVQAFTCRVRVQRSNDGKESRGSSLTLPCDVWRIDGGGFAWRLDVDAALCLGR